MLTTIKKHFIKNFKNILISKNIFKFKELKLNKYIYILMDSTYLTLKILSIFILKIFNIKKKTKKKTKCKIISNKIEFIQNFLVYVYPYNLNLNFIDLNKNRVFLLFIIKQINNSYLNFILRFKYLNLKLKKYIKFKINYNIKKIKAISLFFYNYSQIPLVKFKV